MNHVLVALDQSEERVAVQAKTIRELFDSEEKMAHLYHDFTDNPEGTSITQVGAVTHAANILEDAGFDVQYHETSGDPADTIIETADELDVDVICIAGRKRSPQARSSSEASRRKSSSTPPDPSSSATPARTTEVPVARRGTLQHYPPGSPMTPASRSRSISSGV